MALSFDQAADIVTNGDSTSGSATSRALGYGNLVSNTDGLYEIQRTNHFSVVFPRGTLEQEWAETIEMAVEAFQLPTLTIDPINLNRGNQTYKVAGKPTVEIGDITLKDFIGADTEMALMKWMNQVYDPKNQRMGWAHIYKKNLTLIEYSPDGTVERQWTLEGVWPSTMTAGSMTAEGGDKKELTASLQVDNAYRKENSKVGAPPRYVP